jgi:ribonuclease HII
MRWVIGIDEVGRGALAGPVLVTAAMVAVDAKGQVLHAPFRGLKDSKKLSAKQREEWFADIKKYPGAKFASARVYPRGIEKFNISAAANKAALSACNKLLRKNETSSNTLIFLDGGLFLGSKFAQIKNHKHAKTLAKADENIPAVAVASIVAKVSRDRFMVRLAKRYPEYGFEVHKGYGTQLHLKAIKKHGSCDAHRLTFLRKKPIISG